MMTVTIRRMGVAGAVILLIPPQWRTIGSTLPPLHDDWRLDDVTIRRMGVAGAVILLITLWGFLRGGLRPSEKSQSFPRLACFTS